MSIKRTALRTAFLVVAAALVSACAGPQVTARNVVDAPTAAHSQPATQIFMPNAKINRITVEVPRSLKVSERNSYYPKGDIVWRGDAFGDRHAQVHAILTESAQRMAKRMTGERPVDMHIRLTRFHGLSEKARYSTGGVHNINFILTLTDPATGTILRGPREVVTNLDAFGGTAAIAADKRGETQKVRVTGFLEQVLVTELLTPGGYQEQGGGFFVALNRQ